MKLEEVEVCVKATHEGIGKAFLAAGSALREAEGDPTIPAHVTRQIEEAWILLSVAWFDTRPDHTVPETR